MIHLIQYEERAPQCCTAGPPFSLKLQQRESDADIMYGMCAARPVVELVQQHSWQLLKPEASFSSHSRPCIVPDLSDTPVAMHRAQVLEKGEML